MNRTGMMAIAALVLALAGAAIWLLLDDASQPGTPVAVQVGPVNLIIPRGYIRTAHVRNGGYATELELAASAADFRPPQKGVKVDAETVDTWARTVFFAVTPSDGSLNPAERTSKLYARFFEPGDWSHPGGLVMRRFEKGSPYEKEELYMAPPEGRLFAARCLRPRQPPDGLPNTCIAEFRMNGLDIRMRFSPDRLADWEKLMQGSKGLIKSFLR